MRARRILYRLLRPVRSGGLMSLQAVRTDAPLVVMTYDDGPEAGTTPAVLDALAASKATATFFVLVGRAEREPALLREVIAAGHEVGLHGLDHRSLSLYSSEQVRLRTIEGKERLEHLTGTSIRWFRPPYGVQSIAAVRAVRAAGLRSVVWSNTLRDSSDVEPRVRLAAASQSAHPGAVVLAHDGYADAFDGVDDGPRPEFDRGELTRDVLSLFADRGLAATSLEKALQQGTPRLRSWFWQ